MDDSILEPLAAYKNLYEDLLSKNLDDAFDDLVKRSGIAVAKNRETAKAYRGEISTRDGYAKQAKKLDVIGTLLKAMIFICAIACAVGIAFLALDVTLAGALTLSVSALVILACVLALTLKVNPQKKGIDALVAEHQKKADEILKTAWQQMSALNALFDDSVTKTVIEKTVPLIKLDDNFKMRRYDYLSAKYGFGANNDENRSTIGILTGEILGNPFVVDRELVKSIVNHVYQGSIVIFWTTYYTDSEGHTHAQEHSQTLVATIEKPMPVFNEQTRLIYGNGAAPDLSFSHSPTHAEQLSADELKRKVKSGARRIRRKQDKALKNGKSSFTEMGNEQFDVLFNALDRDNEVQFRLLFTPLAQKNMLALMKDPAGFGDDFTFNKRRCLNYVSSEHSARWDMDTNSERYCSFDVDASRKIFKTFNQQYFKSLYFDLAPLLSIPLYQQYKPEEYIYKDSYHRNYTDYEAEFCANALGQNAFSHPASVTPSILKTALVDKQGETDSVEVTAYSYRTERRVEFVPRLGGDGLMHNVPVYWDEYIPLSRKSSVKLKELGYSGREYRNKAEEAPFKTILDRFSRKSYVHGILCCMTGEDDGDFDAEFEDLKNKK